MNNRRGRIIGVFVASVCALTLGGAALQRSVAGAGTDGQQLSFVTPIAGPAGTEVTVQGTDCTSVAGHTEVFLYANNAPSVRLAMGQTGISFQNVPWTATLTVPAVDPGGAYSIGAQCWGDGYWQGTPGMQALYFTYASVPFTVGDDVVTTTTTVAPVTTPTTVHSQSRPAVQLGKIQYDSPGPDDGSNASLNGEYVTIRNSSSFAKVLKGAVLHDAHRHVYTFASYSIAGGGTVRLPTGKGRNTPTDLYWGLTSYVWNNNADKATLNAASGMNLATCTWTTRGTGWKACFKTP